MNLDQRDFELIIRQCELQMDFTPDSVRGFMEAYSYAKDDITDPQPWTAEAVEFQIRLYASKIKPWHNANGYRQRAVYVGHDAKMDWQSIPRAMDGFCDTFADFMNGNNSLKLLEGDEFTDAITPKMLYTWFEDIHPFIDGNGRVGHLLWAIARSKIIGSWPQELPPNVFGDPRITKEEAG